MVKVKFCGFTTIGDVLAAVEAGADLLGFNFYPPSPRYVTPQKCAGLIARLLNEMNGSGDHIRTVGVFVNTPPKQVLSIVDECGLDLAQLSGNEPPSDLEVIGEKAFKVIRAIGRHTILNESRKYLFRENAPAFLVDATSSGQYGGTGKVADWEQARELASRFPILLAGGLNSVNVTDAVRLVKPWGVDVASGIEVKPGRKDIKKMNAFVNALRYSKLEESK